VDGELSWGVFWEELYVNLEEVACGWGIFLGSILTLNLGKLACEFGENLHVNSGRILGRIFLGRRFGRICIVKVS
jgi:hypothetical protein